MEEKFEDVLSNVASRLANASEDEFDQVIVDSLRELVVCLGLDRSTIGLFSDHGAKLRVAYTCAAEGVPMVPMDFMIEAEIPWVTQQIRSGHIVFISKTADLPPPAERDRTYLLEHGIVSTTFIPLIIEETIVGALGFGLLNTNGKNSQSNSSRLRLAAEVISLGIRRHQYASGLKRISQAMNETSVKAGVPVGGRKDQYRELAMRLIDIEQKERLRMGDVLHEDVMQSLAGVSMLINLGIDGGDEDPVGRHTLVALGDALAKLRQLAAILRPEAAQSCKIGDWVQWLVVRSRGASEAEIEVSVDEDVEPLEKEIRVFLYESARKLLDNALTHSGATKIELELKRVNGDVKLTVSDNGVGFDPSLLDAMPATNVGLFSIRELADLLGGDMEIDSRNGQKTRIVVTIPT